MKHSISADVLSLDLVLQILERQKVITASMARQFKQRAPQVMKKLQRQRRDPKIPINGIEILLQLHPRDVDQKPLTEDKIMQAIAKEAQLPFLKLDPLKLDPEWVTETLHYPFAKHHVVLPVKNQDGTILMAVDNPFRLSFRELLSQTLKAPVELVVSSRSDILRILTEFYGFRASIQAAANDYAKDPDLHNFEQLIALKNVEDIDPTDAHVTKAVDYLLNYAFSHQASDIHIEPKRDRSIVRLRIDGILHTIQEIPKSVHAPMVSRIKMLARMDIAEKRRPQDGRIKTAYKQREIELRISSMPVAFGEKIVVRILDPEHLLRDIRDLGMPPEDFKKFKRFLSHKHGMILVTGPTGSGKTSTLYSCLKFLSNPKVNITTIEDPIEMVYEEFNQVQVQPKIDLGFANLLRTVLRQDPDIIMIGEIRDEETAQMAVQAALTGHLVFSTLHTNDAPSSVIRLIDLGVKPFLIASTLIGVIAQRLVRKICPACKRETVLTEAQLAALNLKRASARAHSLRIAYGSKCPVCRYTGLKGRTAVFEILEIDETLRQLIQDQANAETLKKAARSEGMLTLKEAAIRKLAQQEIPYEEVFL